MRASGEVGDGIVVKPRSPKVESSVGTVVSTTNTAHGRVLNARYKQETTKATVKEVEVVRHGMKRLETRMHELESRVQYVNPWVVQHMWELLCKLREKIGVRAFEQRERSVEMSLRGSCAQTHTEPRRANASTTSSPQWFPQRAARSPSVPKRLFDVSVDGEGTVADDLDTSLSSESSGSAGTMSRECNAESIQKSQLSVAPQCGQNDSSGDIHNHTWQQRRVEKRVEELEAQMLWQCAEQNESAARMNIAMEEGAARHIVLVQHTHRIAAAISRVQQHQMQMNPCDALGQQSPLCTHDKEQQEVEFDALYPNQCARHFSEIPSPPEIFSKCSPILQTGEFPSHLLSPPRHCHPITNSSGSNNDKSRRSCSKPNGMSGGENKCFSGARDGVMPITMVESLLRDREARHCLVKEIVHDLDAAVRQRACTSPTTNNNHSSSDGHSDWDGSNSFISALLHAVREAAIGDEWRQCSARESTARAAAEDQMWRRVAEREAEWERRATAELRETQAQLQSVLAGGHEDAEACRAVRTELLRLYDEVMCATEQLAARRKSPECAEGLGLGRAFDVSKKKSAVMREWESQFATLATSVADIPADVEGERVQKGSQWMQEPHLSQVPEETQTDTHTLQQRLLNGTAQRNSAESHSATLQERMADVQEAIAIVARKLRAAEDRLDDSKANSSAVQAVTERLRVVEQQLDKIPTLLAPPPPPLPLPMTEQKEAVRSDGDDGSLNSISVEAAMEFVQGVLHTQQSGRSPGSYTQTLSALCAVLQHVAHLYNNGTGTIGGSLQLIFAMPPFAVPADVLPACRAYLREHSAAELKEAMGALAIRRPVAEVLCDVYYWIQSHVLAADKEKLRGTEEAAEKRVNSKSIQVGEESLETNCKARDTHDRNSQTNEEGKADVPHREQTAWTRNADAAGQTHSQQLPMPDTIETPCAACGASPVCSALEALALMRSPGDYYGGRVNHCQHRHPCRAEKCMNCTPTVSYSHSAQTPNDEVNQCLFRSHDVSMSPLNAANSFALGKRGNTLEGDPGEVDTAPPCNPRVQSSHYHRYQKKTTGACECLPLPTAVSAFTDPQMPKGAESHGRMRMKNPQPFYTATSERPPQQRGALEVNRRSNAAGDNAGTIGGTNNYRNNNNKNINNVYTSGHFFNDKTSLVLQSNRPLYSHRSTLSNSTRGREENVAGIRAAQRTTTRW